MESTTFSVRTEVFEGPLEVLLQLVEKRKLFVNDISLAQVADDYIAHVRSFKRFPLDDAAGFVFVASILVLIKSKSLLPKLDLSEEEEVSVEELQRRLRDYKRMKELSVHIAERFGKTIIFPRVHVSAHIQPIFAPEQNINKENMLASVLSVIKKIPRSEPMRKSTVNATIRLEDVIKDLSKRIRENFCMSFHDFLGEAKIKKKTVAISFLAVLELVKQGELLVQQSTMFSDIDMETRKIQTPEY